MGSGKGCPNLGRARGARRIMFESTASRRKLAKEALTLGAAKLPIRRNS